MSCILFKLVKVVLSILANKTKIEFEYHVVQCSAYCSSISQELTRSIYNNELNNLANIQFLHIVLHKPKLVK